MPVPPFSFKRLTISCLLPAVAAIVAIFYTFTSYNTITRASTTAIMSLSSKLSITDVNLKGERVLIRVDFNVPWVSFGTCAYPGLTLQSGQAAEHHQPCRQPKLYYFNTSELTS